MNILLTILTPLLVGFGLAFAFATSKKEKSRKNEKLNRNDFVIRSSYSWAVIMITLNSVITAFLIFGNIGEPLPLGVNIVLGALLLIFSLGITQAFREKVHVKGKNIIYTPTFGWSRTYTFDGLDSVEKRKTGIYVYANGRRAFSLDPAGIGTGLFLELYRKQ